MVKKSSTPPKYEASHYDDYGFDLQEDFSLFLEEARQLGSAAKLKNSSVHPEESGKTGSDKEKKGKKSWKSSLISWWKVDKKSKHREEPTNDSKSKVSRKRQGQVSGPIYKSYKGADRKHWLPTSGPLTNLFKPTKTEEREIPYTSLHQQNSPCAMHNYGPLYGVA
ncbi:uncharacterized protein LOC133287315 [Gastrolobium bilobum]|uniref:uncharacterized protein LOC133287315 n=1 Tax=Gastrolobium bilobum TaxID=150636 RepID=UPI002AB048DD|nr:uncharacterized protein LOC133287315 [Gastrolobium bilobum]